MALSRPSARTGSSRLSLKQQVEVRKVFKVFDADESGAISLKELRLAIRAVGVEVDQQKLRQLVRSMDFNSSGEIELDEFETIVSKFLVHDDAVYAHAADAFTVFDDDHKGHVTREDIQRVAHLVGQNISASELENLMSCIDRVGCGVINQEDFTFALEKCSKLLLDKNFELS